MGIPKQQGKILMNKKLLITFQKYLQKQFPGQPKRIIFTYLI